MAIVVDDHLLLDLLADDPAEWLRAESAHSAVYTTAAWYYRLANAAHRGTGDGALSRKLARLPETFRAERIDNTEAKWLAERIGRNGRLHDNERALVKFIGQSSPSIHPDLRTLLEKVA